MDASSATAAGGARIAAAFSAARQGGCRAALMPFLMGGFPSLNTSAQIAEAYVDGGAHLVELGLPAVGPRCDGPVIRSAATAALRAGATADKILEIARTVSQRVPVVIMSYASVVLARGAQRFANDLRVAGASGLIVPDMPLKENAALLDACDAADIALVPVVAPSIGDEAVAQIVTHARGFVYAISVSGTTGERTALSDDAPRLIERVKTHSRVPVALGFGISTPAHAKQAASAGANGVIVGSRLVRAAAEAANPPAAVRGLVAGLSLGLQDCRPRQQREPGPPATLARRHARRRAASPAGSAERTSAAHH